MSKLYEIKNGSITIYVGDWRNAEFRFKGFTIENDPDNYYVSHSGRYDPSPPDGRAIVEVGEYLYTMYRAEADAQLQKYTEDNITRYDFYTECEDNSFPFWTEIVNKAGIEPTTNNNYEVDLSELMNGVVGLSTHGVTIKYDFIERKTVGYESRYTRSEPIVSAMEVFYRDKMLREILALEQYRRGIGVPAYGELVKLREFLQAKKSVKFVMKSGKVYELKKDSLWVRDIVSHYVKESRIYFNLNNNY